MLFDIINALKSSYPGLQTSPPIHQEVISNGTIQGALDYNAAGFSLYRLTSIDGKFQLMLQQNQITLHWVRRDEENVGNYPGFEFIFNEFMKVMDLIRRSVRIYNVDLTNEIKEYYLCYNDRVNLTFQESIGFALEDILTVGLPNFKMNGKSYPTNHIVARYSFDCPDIDGFSIVGIQTQSVGNIKLLTVENKLKGIFNDKSDLKGWFNAAHSVQLSSFENLFSSRVLETWK